MRAPKARVLPLDDTPIGDCNTFYFITLQKSQETVQVYPFSQTMRYAQKIILEISTIYLR